ncbi:IS91 family transposase [Labilibaculum manganireducens]|uniref:IS91 family transposase n=1 Tax=Labilibaculum manganireducens TaxID=1940525 RepID=UPI0029F4FA20|nr:IS91 family transposase [Labilibaculum manganireducens]
MKAKYEVADILRRNHHKLEQKVPNRWKLRTLYAIEICRTATLGGHIDQCLNSDCKGIHISYNSCRNRHCPKCQGHKRQQWILARENELINVSYYHLVFTLPSELNKLTFANQKTVYSILFKTAWSVVKDFAANPKFIGGRTGMISILHTWGQNMSFHPHLHCIVPGGGINRNKKWKVAKGKDKYLFPVKAMSKVFRARFTRQIRLHFNLTPEIYKQLFQKKWVVYCKRPFFGSKQVVEYLGRYTHKVAISNHRLIDIAEGKVTFMAKDYRQGGKKHLVSLQDGEFIRRFSLHILPKGFTRIRHYGILSSSLKQEILPILHEKLGSITICLEQKSKHRICPTCKKGELITIRYFDNRGPPKNIKALDTSIIQAIVKIKS